MLQEWGYPCWNIAAGPIIQLDDASKPGPRRAQIISKGMSYSPSHGDIAFTVPMFNENLIRNYVEKTNKES